jgi:hypothetical protein
MHNETVRCARAGQTATLFGTPIIVLEVKPGAIDEVLVFHCHQKYPKKRLF